MNYDFAQHYEVEGIWQQTPQSVWDEYIANGYTIQQAIRQELSYA